MISGNAIWFNKLQNRSIPERPGPTIPFIGNILSLYENIMRKIKPMQFDGIVFTNKKNGVVMRSKIPFVRHPARVPKTAPKIPPKIHVGIESSKVLFAARKTFCETG